MNPQEPNLQIVRARLPNRLCTSKRRATLTRPIGFCRKRKSWTQRQPAMVLNAHDAAVAPAARDTPTANRDAERIRRVEPDVGPQLIPAPIGNKDPFRAFR